MAEPRFGLCDASHAARLRTLRDKIAPILANRIHRHFTDHSVDHSDRVATLAETLASALPTDKRLSSDEAYILYAASYTHDVGMHNELAGMHGRLAQSLAASGTEWAELSEERRLDLLRERHHQVSADMIVASRRLDGSGYTSPPIGLALDDSDFPGEIAAVAESHVEDTESDRYKALVGTPSGSRRLRLLSALLWLGDILDEAQHRALRSKAETLDLNSESIMHWWRHYYTREVVADRPNNLITVFFEFPGGHEREYESVIPELQMPSVRREFDRHREVFSANGLAWTVNSAVRRGVFSTLDQIPPSVMLQILNAVARQKAANASTSERLVSEYEEKARSFGNQQIRELKASQNTLGENEYLRGMESAALDLHEAGGTLSAIVHLRSAIFSSTTNGRAADNHVYVRAASTLGRLLVSRGDNRDAVNALTNANAAAAQLPDSDEVKAHYYRWVAKANLIAGYFRAGREAATKALQLLPVGAAREDVQADLDEAIMLEGLDPTDGDKGHNA